jgi:predicted signal transduction protein with EAL and GGDEF domain
LTWPQSSSSRRGVLARLSGIERGLFVPALGAAVTEALENPPHLSLAEASRSYFKHSPAAELKIDKRFVDSMLVDGQDLERVNVITCITHKFDLKVVVEGIRDPASLDFSRKLGCDMGQE